MLLSSFNTRCLTPSVDHTPKHTAANSGGQSCGLTGCTTDQDYTKLSAAGAGVRIAPVDSRETSCRAGCLKTVDLINENAEGLAGCSSEVSHLLHDTLLVSLDKGLATQSWRADNADEEASRQ